MDFSAITNSLLLIAFLGLPAIRFLAKQGMRAGMVQIHGTTQYFARQALVPVPFSERGTTRELPAVVLRFDGDKQARGAESLARLVDEIVHNTERISEVIVRMNSRGGSVAEYGFVASQMERIRDAGIPLTACVDLYACSGGYWAVAPANKIVASPRAIVGSIGIVVELINWHKLLKNIGLDGRQYELPLGDSLLRYPKSALGATVKRI
jgi:serine protease SohB